MLLTVFSHMAYFLFQTLSVCLGCSFSLLQFGSVPWGQACAVMRAAEPLDCCKASTGTCFWCLLSLPALTALWMGGQVASAGLLLDPCWAGI